MQFCIRFATSPSVHDIYDSFTFGEVSAHDFGA